MKISLIVILWVIAQIIIKKYNKVLRMLEQIVLKENQLILIE